MIPNECELTEDAILSYCADVEKIYNDTMIDYFSETIAEEVVWILKKRMRRKIPKLFIALIKRMSDHEPNKIVLLGDESDSRNPEFSLVIVPIPRPPFSLLLIGSSQCGKTNVVLNLITRFLIYPNSDESIFDEIYIFTPTALSDPKLKILAKHPDLVNKVYLSDKLEIDLIDELLARNPSDFEGGILPHTYIYIYT